MVPRHRDSQLNILPATSHLLNSFHSHSLNCSFMNSFNKHLLSARYVLHMVLNTDTVASKIGKVLTKVTKHLGEKYSEQRIRIV